MSLVEEWERASLAQHGMWITERTGAGGPVYRMPLAVHLDGPLEAEAMLAACAAVVRRHPILASALAERDGQVWTLPAEVPPPILFEDVSGDGPGPQAGVTITGALAELTAGLPGSPEWIAARAAEPLDVRTGPVSRFTLFRLGPDRHLLLVVAHHAVFDGMSKDVLLRDLAAAYGGAGLGPLPVPYGEAARAEQDRVEADLEAAAEFWRPRWHDRDVLLPGAGRSSLRAAPGDAVDLALGGEVAEAAGRLGVTRFELVLAALQALLHAYGNEPVTVAVDLSTRTEETRDHIGPFVNELPVTCAPYGGTFAEFAEAVRRELRAVYRYRHVPLARALGGIGPRTALTPVSVSYRARSGGDPVFPGLDARVEWAMFNGTVRNTLHLQAVDGPAGLSARLQFNPAVLDRAGCEAVAGHLRDLLAAVAVRPDAPIGELPLPRPAQAQAQVDAADAGSGTETAPAGQPAAGAGTDAALVEQVAAIWRDVLGLEEVLPDDDLFDLGGHSLTITQIIAQVRDRMGIELSFEVFIDDPTVTGVADEIARSR
ncbi:condensation domain-containing protein [Planobispora siamensis]|uniref:condensation domain-containing protein n=1 Tax=Planobispora siamensis TaxID=936338 RepID=UPI0019504F4C|nr:condensation domain-containing protein [Planobispora siamensis]